MDKDHDSIDFRVQPDPMIPKGFAVFLVSPEDMHRMQGMGWNVEKPIPGTHYTENRITFKAKLDG